VSSLIQSIFLLEGLLWLSKWDRWRVSGSTFENCWSSLDVVPKNPYLHSRFRTQVKADGFAKL